MHRRAARTLVAALFCAALLAPASAGAYTISPATSPEGDELIFDVTLELGDSLVAQFDPQPGTATEGADFDGGPKTRNAMGEVRVPTTEDDVDEPDETVRLVAPDGAEGTGTITDDDPAPALSISDLTVAENEAGDAKLTITAANPKSVDVVIPLSVAGGTDISVPATVTLVAGSKTVDVPLTIANDVEDEADEAFEVTIGNATGATVAKPKGTVTIVNDDLRTVDISDGSVAEGSAGTSVLQFTVRLSGPTFRPVTIAIATGDGTATAPSDYLSRLGTVSFAPGQTVQTFDVQIVGDTRREETEVFGVGVGNPVNARVGDSIGLGVIVDDDGGNAPGTGNGTGSGTGTGTGTGSADVTPPKISIVGPRASGRRVTLRVSCPSGERRCAGRVSFFTVADRRAKPRMLRKERRLGVKSFSLRGGARKTVTLTLPSAVLRAARAARRLKVQAFAVTEDAAGNVDTRNVTSTLRFRRARS
jgi:hypothetical protein